MTWLLAFATVGSVAIVCAAVIAWKFLNKIDK